MKVQTAVILLVTAFGYCLAESEPLIELYNSGPDSKIVGGEEAEKGRYPYAVALSSAKTSHPFCGGTLVAPSVVYTAAHCPTPKWARIGCHNVGDSCELIRISSSVKHPNFNANTFKDDYQLLKLSQPSKATPIPYVANSDWDSLATGLDVVAMGWGATSYEGSSSKVLRQVELDVVSQSSCSSSYGRQYEIYDSMLCATRRGKDSCQGDSGGPLIVKCNKGDTLVGIVSWGIECATDRYPGVYARVSANTNWFLEQMEEFGELAAIKSPPLVDNPCSSTGTPTTSPTAYPTNPPVAPTPFPTTFSPTKFPTPPPSAYPTAYPTNPPGSNNGNDDSGGFFCWLMPFLC